ncbi:histidine phosphatase family protein [Nonomuraea sp. SMC257]|uniref:Histidine phosphatase family protein n=1 Tax=Nonomuraea montanisoli TaxID=2741721 RepID=A0A7Y6M1Y2_9ACTN|nr:histidine phosphatase family protein [Nonomuraea montanisoli]NUW31577.1 histidine phosphatase family protein [Nonomuraea montanisoli]
MGVRLVYETHSVTVDNEIGIATGILPGELSQRGRELAVELGVRRRDVDVVYCSDLRRAVQTVEIAFPVRDRDGKEVRVDARLRECDYGIHNGRPVSEVAALRRRYIDVPWPGGQSYRDVVAATASFLEDCMKEWQGRTVLVVAHSANRWALQNLLEGVPLEELVDAPFVWRPGWEFTVATWPV